MCVSGGSTRNHRAVRGTSSPAPADGSDAGTGGSYQRDRRALRMAIATGPAVEVRMT